MPSRRLGAENVSPMVLSDIELAAIMHNLQYTEAQCRRERSSVSVIDRVHDEFKRSKTQTVRTRYRVNRTLRNNSCEFQ